MAFLVLGAALGAASPALHNWIHSGAGQPGHECAITLFQQHHLAATDGAAIFEVAIFSLITLVLLAKTVSFPAVTSLLPPGRAPPVWSSSLAVVG